MPPTLPVCLREWDKLKEEDRTARLAEFLGANPSLGQSQEVHQLDGYKR